MKVFRVIDFETTGFPPEAGVIEIGWTDLVWEGKTMDIGETHSCFTNPGIPISTGAKATHHILESDLHGAPHPDKLLATLDDGADFIVAHNLKFELAFYHTAVPTICTLKCARALVPEARANNGGYKNQELRYFFNFPLDRNRADPPHRAGPDTYVTAWLLRQLLVISAKMGGDFVGRLVELSNSNAPATHLTFGKYQGMAFTEVARIDRKYLLWILNNPRAEPEVIAATKQALGIS